MELEQFIQERKSGMTTDEIHQVYSVGEVTIKTFEIAYQCHIKGITMDQVQELIERFEFINPGHTSTIDLLDNEVQMHTEESYVNACKSMNKMSYPLIKE